MSFASREGGEENTTAILEARMGPQTLAELIGALSPIIWTCGGGVVLVVLAAMILTR